MANDPAFLFYPGDYLRDTQCLSEKTQVAYDRIMCEHMRNICITQKQLNFFTKRLSDDEKEELEMILKRNGNGYQIEWVAESIEKRRAYSESRRINRTGIKKKTSLTYDKHMENESASEDENSSGVEILDPYPFENFWELYDKKIGKKLKIENKWNKLSEKIRKEIMEYIPYYIKSQSNKKYRKNPETFLNNEGWKDELITEQDGKQTYTDKLREYKNRERDY